MIEIHNIILKPRTFLRRWLLIPKRSIRIQWDRNYYAEFKNDCGEIVAIGYDECRKSGWSVSVDGSVVAQNERWLLPALVKGWWRRARLWDDEAIG